MRGGETNLAENLSCRPFSLPGSKYYCESLVVGVCVCVCAGCVLYVSACARARARVCVCVCVSVCCGCAATMHCKPGRQSTLESRVLCDEFISADESYRNAINREI